MAAWAALLANRFCMSFSHHIGSVLICMSSTQPWYHTPSSSSTSKPSRAGVRVSRGRAEGRKERVPAGVTHHPLGWVRGQRVGKSSQSFWLWTSVCLEEASYRSAFFVPWLPSQNNPPFTSCWTLLPQSLTSCFAASFTTAVHERPVQSSPSGTQLVLFSYWCFPVLLMHVVLIVAKHNNVSNTKQIMHIMLFCYPACASTCPNRLQRNSGRHSAL